MGCSYPYFPLESAIVPLNPNPLSLHILQWELAGVSFEAEIHSASRQSNKPVRQTGRARESEERACVSYGLTEPRSWSVHDLLPLDTGKGLLITIYQSTAIEPENKREGLWPRRSRGRAHGMWYALSFTITESSENASYLYTISCFCSVTLNFPKIFVLGWGSPELRTKHSSSALNLTFNRWPEHSEAFERHGFAHIIACFYFKTTG